MDELPDAKKAILMNHEKSIDNLVALLGYNENVVAAIKQLQATGFRFGCHNLPLMQGVIQSKVPYFTFAM